MASKLFCDNTAEFGKVITYYVNSVQKSRSFGSMSAVNWSSIFTKLVASLISLVKTLTGTEADKRQAVIDAVTVFYTSTVEPALATEFNHPFIFNNFIEPAIMRSLPGVIGGLYDALAKVLAPLTGTPATNVPVLY